MDTDRYSRQLRLKEFSEKDQEQLLKSKIAIIGIGATGTVVAELLTRAGIGNITIADRDYIEKSNLQRQTLFDEKDIGKAKAEIAKEKLRKINSEINITSKVCDINAANIEKIIDEKDLIIDCTDNIETRFLINDCSMKHKIPWIYIAAIGATGATMNFVPKDRPCFRCVFKDIPKGSTETCETSGILNSASTAIASFAAAQAIKILTDKKHSTTLTYIDLWDQKIDRIHVKKRTACPSCKGDYEFLERKKETKIITLCGKGAYQIVPAKEKKLDLVKMYPRFKNIGTASVFGPVLHFRHDLIDISIFNDGHAIIKNVKSAVEAKSIYSKYVGN
ncbi:MAG: NAD(P)H-binding protein [Nanohaloarchaea archaeon]|nr:NAD(P)H-binding protein [Candidatus Nanohaloarchaea archaeon]